MSGCAVVERDASLSIVVPMDARPGVNRAFLSSVSVALKECRCNGEVILINDLEIPDASALVAECPHFPVRIFSADGRGQVAAVLKGLSLAKGDVILIMDPDMYSCLDKLPLFLEKINGGVELVVACRKARLDASWFRKIISWLVNFIASRAVGFQLDDFSSPMMMTNRYALSRLMSNSGWSRFPRLLIYSQCRSSYASVEVTVCKVAVVSNYNWKKLLQAFYVFFMELIRFKKSEASR